MLKIPVEEMSMSMSDAALYQSDTAPSMVATWKPFVYTCRAFLEENDIKTSRSRFRGSVC